MQHKTVLFTAAIGIAVLSVSFLLRQSRLAAADEQPNTQDKRTPVIVELFTSEGCSSCPSADKLLANLVKKQDIPGAQIIALSEHVDYWNRLGWADPFSSAAFSARQSEYAQGFRLDSVYTPQMVVDGQSEFVGSDSVQARSAIVRLAKSPKATVTVEKVETKGLMKPNALPLQVTVTPGSGARHGETADVYLAVTEDNLRSEVRRGENSGRTLDHVAVVRSMIKIGTITGADPTVVKPVPTLNPTWKRKDLNAVVFVQERGSHRIVGAGTLAL